MAVRWTGSVSDDLNKRLRHLPPAKHAVDESRRSGPGPLSVTLRRGPDFFLIYRDASRRDGPEVVSSPIQVQLINRYMNPGRKPRDAAAYAALTSLIEGGIVLEVGDYCVVLPIRTW